ncbi:MAG: hypothetical protein WKF37_22395 [Bryobacteraceae bacterium]
MAKLSPGFQVIEGDAPIQSRKKGELLIVLRNNRVIAGENPEAVQEMANLSKTSLRSSEFGMKLQEAFQRGTGILVGVDLQRLTQSEVGARPRNAETMRNLGIDAARFLIAEQKTTNDQTQHSAVVSFAGDRRGVASWLGVPGPMGGLSFVSPEAQLAASLVVKDRTQILDELFSFLRSQDSKVLRDLAEFERLVGVDIRNDVAASLGGEATIALDGPLLLPSWKLILEVNQTTSLQSALARL